MGNKRLTIQRVDQFIRLLGATEKVNGYAEQQKQHAIACSNNYCRELELSLIHICYSVYII